MTHRTDLSRRRVLRGAATLGAAAALAGCERLGLGGKAKPTFQGVDITGADYARQLALPDTDGRLRTLGDFKGKVTVVFFGYTQCPDVCPTTLAELAEVKRALGADGQRLQGVFVTLDPERDTPQVLKAYLQHFDPGFVALRGTPEQTAATAKEFKIFFTKVPGKAEGSYTLDHTAGAFIFDPEGRVRLFTRYGAGAKAMAGDIQQLLKEA